MPRPRSFDEQALLDCAQEVFWTRGYDRTSIEDVSAGSGVGNGSIYSAYKNKLGLFLAVFKRYCNGRVNLVDSVIGAHSGSFESAVANYLDEIVGDCTSHSDLRGCLMLNSLAELGPRFPEVLRVGRKSTSEMEQIVGRRVARAVEEGELSLTDNEIHALGAHIILVSQGLIQLSRLGTPTTRLRSIATTSARMSSLLTPA